MDFLQLFAGLLPLRREGFSLLVDLCRRLFEVGDAGGDDGARLLLAVAGFFAEVRNLPFAARSEFHLDLIVEARDHYRLRDIPGHHGSEGEAETGEYAKP